MLLKLRMLSLLFAALSSATAAVAEPLYQHLRIIAPAAPGGGWDQTARAMQQVLQAAGIVSTSSVENIPGAAGTIGLARFISAERGKGDVVLLSGLIMLGAVVTHQSPVTLRDVTPIARLLGEYEVIVVPAASPYRTLGELLAAFRQRPESIAWGGGSAGGTDQILAGLVADAVGVPPHRVNYIAFSGGGASMSAILGGQVTAGINGLAEFAPHIAAGTVRVLAISSAARLPDVDAPTLRELGLDIELENWRSLVAPPGLSAADRRQLERAVERMVRSQEWRETLVRFRWSDRYLAGEPFAQFVSEEEARVVSILEKLGTGGAQPSSSLTAGPYPMFVIAGLSFTFIALFVSIVRSDEARPTAQSAHRPGGRRAVGWIVLALLLHLVLIERAGFVLASIPLFWLTARAFDPRHPARDAVLAIALSLGAYLLFAHLLQISLPAGWLASWI